MLQDKQKGAYLGTEINEKWYKRYTHNGLFARGNGEFWFDDDALYFRRYLTKKPLRFAFKDIQALKTGTWHAGRWCFGYPVLKILWMQDGQQLSSGLLLTRNAQKLKEIQSFIQQNLANHNTDL